ncbi:3-keto-disaccharide hydrolase [Pedobacter sp.]|uniref:3-keto-disaccharide hydrolase n=1 Tax=Pedobacter sp. TaxID=1411316 RepID=UPI003BAA2CD8
MKISVLKAGSTALVWLVGTCLAFGQQPNIPLTDLSAFKEPGNSWTLVGDVTVDMNIVNAVKSTKGTGILLNTSTPKKPGFDLYTIKEYGDMVLELDYLVAKGANSGIFLQSNYEIQIEDSWTLTNPVSSSNGGAHERWNNDKPEGEKGFDGSAPRQNVSKAPGLWQHIKIVFQAPKFDASGIKIANARLLSVDLNGVTIHENVELTGATRGGFGTEKALAALRLQGDQGTVAFRNISITDIPVATAQNGRRGGGGGDPIYVDAPVNTMIRSFVDVLPGVRSVHAISVGGAQQTAYSYDLDNGTLLHGWHGGFLDATPMWDGRGNGTSRPLGSVTRFTSKPVLAIAKLATPESAWVPDTAGTGFRTKGYVMDSQERPEFKYIIYGTKVTDAVKVMENGQGLTREVTIEQPAKDLYLLLGEVKDINEVSKGLYLVDDKAYYLQFPNGEKPIVRDANGKKQLIIPIGSKLNYSILF